jgi:hypothetical protein
MPNQHGSGSEILLMFFPFFCKLTGGALFCAKFIFFAEKTGAGDRHVALCMKESAGILW